MIRPILLRIHERERVASEKKLEVWVCQRIELKKSQVLT